MKNTKNFNIITILLLCGFIFIAAFDFNSNDKVTDPRDSLTLVATPDITKAELFLHIEYLASDELGGRGSGSIEDSLSRIYIANEFEKYGLKPFGDDGYFQYFEKSKVNSTYGYYSDEYTKDAQRTANVIGMLEGSDPDLKNEFILVGAHFDHEGKKKVRNKTNLEIYNGADDNASGTSGVMEVAQRFSANKELTKRSIIFACFDAEEDGLLGSYYFTDSKIFKDNKIVAMINLDMIGRLKYNMLTLNAVGTSTIWTPLANEINKNYEFDLDLKKKGLDGSDHTPFISKRIPSVFFFTGLHNEYHTPSDDFWKINYDGEVKILNFVFDFICAVSNNYTEIPFTNPNKK